MKKIFVFIVLSFSSILMFSQVDTTKKELPLQIEAPPSFPGGETAMMDWIKAKITYIGVPQAENEAGIGGKCYVTFIIDKEGNVTESKILKGVPDGPGYDKLALQVVNAMPKWNPGKQNGRAISVQYTLPIGFNVRPLFVVEKSKDEAKTHYNKGVEFSKNSEYERAIEEFNEAVNLIPNYIDALYNRGTMFFKLNKKEDACKDWNYIKSLGIADADFLINKYCK
ncbi:MAG: TonB family protein [Bacteroidota bacterium]